MKISFDQVKRDKTFCERGLAFEDAALVFEAQTVEFADLRVEYGEERIICYGYLATRLVVIGYVKRGDYRHIFSMRKANEREKKRLESYFSI